MKVKRLFYLSMVVGVAVLGVLSTPAIRALMTGERSIHAAAQAEDPALLLDLSVSGIADSEFPDASQEGGHEMTVSPLAPKGATVGVAGNSDAAWMMLLLGGAGGGLTASIIAIPSSGAVPLNVRFAGQVEGGKPPYSFSWDLNGDGKQDDTRQSFRYLYTQYGTFDVTLKVFDSDNASSTAAVKIHALSAPTVVATASPTTGGAPLEVSFNAIASDFDGTVVLYRWDFDGNGIYEYSSTETPATKHTYTSKGSYKATIEVTDDNGLKNTGFVTIEVGSAPVAHASASPKSGATPLQVKFVGTGSDSDGTIVLYEWDFDGDGKFDWKKAADGNATYSYNSSGSFIATLRVTDNNGLSATDSVFITAGAAPVALPRAYPTSGEVPLKVTFFTDGYSVEKTPYYYDWDFDGDGTYDLHIMAAMNSSFTYTKAGTYNATLKVTDIDGLSGIASIPITVTDPNPQGYPTAFASAVPTNGGSPLMVALRGRGTSPGGSITKYEWDFEGDGIYDWQEEATAPGQLGVLIKVGYYSVPSFGDIDGDGDFDLLVGNDNGTISYFRNNGKKTAALWKSMGLLTDSTGNRIKVSYNSAPALVDIDGDGDLDLFVGEYYGTVIFYENTGTKTNPVWTLRAAVKDAGGNTIDVGYNSIPTFADINGDGRLDLLIGEYYGEVIYYQNTGSNTVPKWTLVGPLNDAGGTAITGGYNAAPAFVDIDGDGDLDLFVGGYYGAVAFYRNTGTASGPIWTSVGNLTDADGNTISASYSAAPAFVDINGNGVKDLFLGSYYGGIYYYGNTGTTASPTWRLVTSKYDSVGVDSYAVPALADTDGDGDLDLFVGEGNGRIAQFKNEGDAQNPIWMSWGFLTDAGGNTIDVGSNSAPAFADLNNDGIQDLFVGEGYGKVIRYQNTGSKTAPQWTLVGPLTSADGSTISVGYNSTPVYGDIDGDGDLDLLVGEYYGKVIHYRNDGNSTSAKWTYVGPLKDAGGNVINVGYSSRPALADMDGDGNLDLLIGEYYGKIVYYRNTGDVHTPVWTLASTNYESINVQYYAAPAFGDIDNDGDADLFVGNSQGYVYFYPTQGATRHLYENPGTFHPTLRVTGSNGLTATDSVEVRVLGSGSPSAVAKADPTSGNAPLTVKFSGKGVDPDGAIVNYEWDFNGDGVYDWSSASSPNTSYTYSKVGTFKATLRVTDSAENKATDAVALNTTLGITVTRTGVFNPGLGEKGSVCNSYTDSAKVTVKIIDAAGNMVKVLVNDVSRDKGTTYCDEWDGQNAAGKLVQDGVYYYLIEYTINGQKFTYDPRKTAEYKEIAPSRSWSNTFNPYQNKFVEITYPISKPSEIGLQMWIYDCSAPDCVKLIRTVYTREPVGAGSHIALWDGVDDRGIPVTVGDYAVRLWAYELADNAIIVSGNRPSISALSAAPNYYTTGYNPYRSGVTTQPAVSFTLSKVADLEIRIINSLGVVVRKMNKPGLPAGANSIVWDGKDQSGNSVLPGGYSIQLTAVDATGSRSLPRYASIILSE